MKAHYIAIVIPSGINGLDEARFLYIPSVGQLSCGGKNFIPAENIYQRVNRVPESFQVSEKDFEKLRNGEVVENIKYIGSVEISDRLVGKLTQFFDRCEEINSSILEKVDKNIGFLEKAVKEKLSKSLIE